MQSQVAIVTKTNRIPPPAAAATTVYIELSSSLVLLLGTTEGDVGGIDVEGPRLENKQYI